MYMFCINYESIVPAINLARIPAMNLAEDRNSQLPKILPGFLCMNLVKILSTGNFSSRRDLARFPARLWSPGISLPAEILGKILAAGNFASRRDSRQHSRRDFGRREFSFPPRIPPRFPARFWPPGISFPAENPAGFPPGMKIPPAKISPGSRRDSRRDPAKIPPRSRSFFYKGCEISTTFFRSRHQATNLEKQKQTKWIEIYQSQLTDVTF